MTVYVDDMEAPFGTMIMCHMYADTHAELVTMANKIGVQLRWIQYAGDPVKVHFDIAQSKRKKAVKAGATEVSMMDFGNHGGRPGLHDWGKCPRVWVPGNQRLCLNCGAPFPALIGSSVFDEPCPRMPQ